MRRNVVPLACAALLLVTGLTSCQKIDRVEQVQGPLAVEAIQSGDAIPLDYGELVGVTQDPVRQWQAVLWFEGPNRDITAVWVNTGQRRVLGSMKIPRR